MRRWLFLLGGLIVWAVHFFGVYGIASLADVISRADAPGARWATGLFTLACAAANALLLMTALRRRRGEGDELDRMIASIAGLGAGLSLVTVLWQGLPALIGH